MNVFYVPDAGGYTGIINDLCLPGAYNLPEGTEINNSLRGEWGKSEKGTHIC